VVAPAFGDVQVADVFEGRDDGGADGGQVGRPLPLRETAGTRATQVAADTRLEETVMLRPKTPPYAWWNYHDAYGKTP
jgi:hypothetical protein